MKRKKTPKNIEKEVLVMSIRRCCLCFGLSNTEDQDVKQGQIAHLDGNPDNCNIENLVFLCLDHHDRYDGTTRQSKGFTKDEVKHYRKMLYNFFLLSPILLNKIGAATVKKYYARSTGYINSEYA